MEENQTYYEMMFKRKSFHLFKGTGNISKEELLMISKKWESLKPLNEKIKTDIRIVPADETTCKRGEEYCILLYSEKREGYLQNIGYLGEQLDLYLTLHDIGTLWFGIGKAEEEKLYELDFVIMIAIAKMPADKFRKDMFKSKRKPLSEIWSGAFYEDIGNIVRFAPSACNTQPWKVEAEEKLLKVYRYKKAGKRGIMPALKVAYYNRIDIGIFLLFLEVCMNRKGLVFTRELLADETDDVSEQVPVAIYRIEENRSYERI